MLLLFLLLLLRISLIRSFHISNSNTKKFNSNSKNVLSMNGVDPEYWNRPGPWDERNLDSLLNANKAWAQSRVKVDPNFFEDHKKGHAPKILWIGCSDARVPANEMIGEPPGSVFVHRNIANQVVNTDFNCMSVIQYAVDVLQVKHIIVCGHYDCGGVRAALEQLDHRSPLENWLRNIRDTYRLHKDELTAIEDLRMRQRRLVELNVIEQCLNIFKTAVVQRRRVQTYIDSKDENSYVKFSEPRVHAFVYEPTTGQATKLKVDFQSYLKDLRQVYDLYRVEGQDEERVEKIIDEVTEKEIITNAPEPRRQRKRDKFIEFFTGKNAGSQDLIL